MFLWGSVKNYEITLTSETDYHHGIVYNSTQYYSNCTSTALLPPVTWAQCFSYLSSARCVVFLNIHVIFWMVFRLTPQLIKQIKMSFSFWNKKKRFQGAPHSLEMGPIPFQGKNFKPRLITENLEKERIKDKIMGLAINQVPPCWQKIHLIFFTRIASNSVKCSHYSSSIWKLDSLLIYVLSCQCGDSS